MEEMIAKIHKTKSWFFEKINKIDKPLARIIKTRDGKSCIAAVVTITKTWKQQQCLSSDEWTKKRSMYTMEY